MSRPLRIEYKDAIYHGVEFGLLLIYLL